MEISQDRGSKNYKRRYPMWKMKPCFIWIVDVTSRSLNSNYNLVQINDVMEPQTW